MNLDEFGSERTKAWNIYRDSDGSPSHAAAIDQKGDPWKSFGTSMHAISFGFVATAILISMFLIMAIFEHLFRPSPPETNGSSDQSGAQKKFGIQQRVSTSHASVLMPGEQYPTYVAQPAPLPCHREGIKWPSHGLNFV